MPIENKNLNHIKRIKKTTEGKLDVLLCKKEDFSKLALLLDNQLKEFNLEPVLFSIPKYAPITKEQFDTACKIWPMLYQKQNSSTPSPSLLTTKELLQIKKFMRLAIKEAIIAANHNQLPIGAAIVNPESDELIALSHDQRAIHPLKHAVMIAIDMAAQYNINKYSESLKDRPYLCATYYLFVTREPCAMCAMAIVHSRFLRVYYGCDHPNLGGAGSRWKIHSNRNLNHHYEVC